MTIPILAGRIFTRADLNGAPVVVIDVVNCATVLERARALSIAGVRFVGEEQWRTVVGVVADVRAHDLSHTIPEFMKGTVYVPYRSRMERWKMVGCPQT